MQAASRMDLLLAKAEPIRDNSCASVREYLSKETFLHLKYDKFVVFLIETMNLSRQETANRVVQRLFKVTLLNMRRGRRNGDVVSSITTIRVHGGVKTSHKV
ncbi:hypothetical protein HGM15179_016015 [Zosterops borbonicus]|uniref:Uncharacterized protein n=1 Tax=Zosterops borbonicus TaxID=364589 RepID=A0A8K1G3H2_9PASS|nr:hypothetical protein HGM15179_016015 [Zosterops borbonicus]